MAGIRINLDLSAFFTDIRKFSRVYSTYDECLAIKDVEEHIKKTFNINETIVLLSDKYLLPSSQSVNILQASENIRVIRGDAVLLGENAVPCVYGNYIDKSHCVHSTPCCMSKESKCEGSGLYSRSSKRRRDAFDIDINISSEQVSVDKKDKKKLREKVNIFGVNGESETREKPKVKKSRDCIPMDEDALQQTGPEVSDIVASEIMQDKHINYSKRKKKKTENDVSKERVVSIQTELSTLNDADEVETKHKKKITDYVANCRNIDSIQTNLSILSDAGEVETKHKKKITDYVASCRNIDSIQTKLSILSDAGGVETKCKKKKTINEVCSDSNQAELSTKNDAETNEIEVSCVSDSKFEGTTDAKTVMHLPKKSRKRIKKRRPKNKTRFLESAKMLYEKVRAISEKEMITVAEELKPEGKQNVHIFFDDDLGDNMLSITVGQEPHITEPLQTSIQNVTANSDSNPEENLLPPVSVHDNTVLPLNPQDIAVNQNNKCDSDDIKPDVEITSQAEDAVNLKLRRALARARASLNSICPEIAKVKESVNGIGKNEEREETSGNLLNSNLLMLINNIKAKPPVFERKKKASEAEKCQENVQQLPLIKNSDHDCMERNETETTFGPDKHINGLALSSASEKTRETKLSEVQLVESSSAKFDVNAYPVVDKFNPGDAILFKTLQLNESYEPVLSGYIFGKVLEVLDEKGSIKLEILRGLHEFKEDLPPGKFSVYDGILGEEENSNSHIKEILSNCIVEPRLLYP